MIPEAGIFLDAGCDAMRIISHDNKYDVVLPVEMNTQVEFDPGNFPSALNFGAAKVRRVALRRYMPTIFLGVRCGADRELVVYPLCFHPDMIADARDLYERLRAKCDGLVDRICCRYLLQTLNRLCREALIRSRCRDPYCCVFGRITRADISVSGSVDNAIGTVVVTAPMSGEAA